MCSEKHVVETEIELDSHADTCIVGNQCLVIHDHNRPVYVFDFDPKSESKSVCIVVVAVAYNKPEMGQAFILC